MKEKRKDQDIRKRLDALFATHLSEDYTLENDYDIDFMVELVNIFRPKNIKKNYSISLSPLLELLSERENYQLYFASYLKNLLKGKDFDSIITDTGIISGNDFIYEVRRRFVARYLPYQPPKNTMQFILNQIFYRDTDPLWLEKIAYDEIASLLTYTSLKPLYEEGKSNFEISEILYALEVLVQRISGRVMEKEVSKMVPEHQNLDSPFLGFQKEFSELNEKLINAEVKYVSTDDLIYKQLLILHKQCEDYIDRAFDNSHKYGISLKVNQSLLRAKQQLFRIKEMLSYLVLEQTDEKWKKSIAFGLQLIRYNSDRTNIRKLIKKSTQTLSYEITQHTAKTGEKYITDTRSEYFKMFKTACGGGLIVAFLCIFKILLGKVVISEFGHAALYSLNYSFGFIVIYLLGFTLATKQPAMTASALISSLVAGDQNKTLSADEKYLIFARFFARVFRSQFIAFVGNVIMAFPMALLLIWGIDKIFDYNIAAQKWTTLLNDLSPVGSAAIFHAAIAGFFLFISGIIAGSIANRDKYDHVYYRIQEHPILKKVFGKSKTKKIAKLYEKKWAGVVSNFWFGVFMGSTFSIGVFLGLNIDIRHITFASGNLALGMYGGDFDIPPSVIIWGIIGIGVIGLVNFLVSFYLSLSIALRSRNIPFSDLRLIAASVWSYFKQKPGSFFFPPKKQSVKNE